MNTLKKLILILVNSFFDGIIIALILLIVISILFGRADFTILDANETVEKGIPSYTVLIIALAVYIPLRYFLTKQTLRLSFSGCAFPMFIIIAAIALILLLFDGLSMLGGIFALIEVYDEIFALNGGLLSYSEISDNIMFGYVLLVVGLSGMNMRVQTLFCLFKARRKSEAISR